MQSNYLIVVKTENIRNILSTSEMTQLYQILDKLAINNMKLELDYKDHHLMSDEILSDNSFEKESTKTVPDGFIKS